MLDEMDHPEVRVQVNDINRKQQSERMYALAWNQPKALIRSQPHPAEKAAQACQVRIRRVDAQTQKRLPG